MVAPLLYAYALLHGDHEMKEQALDILLGLPPERNSCIRDWQALGFRPADAAATQALLQLRREYCDRHECLSCRFGCRILSQTL